MKIHRLDLSKLRNEEHFQFHTEFKAAVERVGVQPLNVDEAFSRYLPLYSNEVEALLIIRGSATTNQLAKAHAERNTIFRGIADAVKSGLNHFDSHKCAAAQRLGLLLGRYGNLARKAYNSETAAIGKLTQEAQGSYATDLAMLGLTEWFAELHTRNIAFDSLMKNRYTEKAGQTEYRMKMVRTQVDAVYRTIVERIEALMLINGTAGYAVFVRELNARIEKFNSLLSTRRGRNAKGADKTEAPSSIIA